jgi:NAD(P) transhydrogenase subunit alpha
VSDRDELFAKSDVILQVQSFGSNTENADDDLKRLKAKQLVIGMMDP